ncbi:amidohydrolase [Marilutibacter chinensis]|uniref:Amidohydrolase n=1 Tax=Marilutibacter chinensis TaxID=2912247 RepID=A0ABS9HVL1_9GAMM|nr:amidohydrolase [Lysobacter chinensis]MCF7222182.1 amidohydrolase [Lysobacter chinensis]
MLRSAHATLAVALAAALACVPAAAADRSDAGKPRASESRFIDDPYPSTYAPIASPPVLIRNATVLTGTGQRLDGADVLMRDGRIVEVGHGLSADGATLIDGTGKWVTPGIIDVHSHLGVYASPGVNAHGDGNEMTSPVTANVWAEHSVWPQDPGFAAALAGGVTSLQILPGSANLVGGRGVTLKNVPATSYQAMKFPGAPWGLKMACGENPKRVYGGRGTAPGTRMGNVAGYRAAFIDAAEYLAKNKPRSADRGKRRWWQGDGDGADSDQATGGKRDLKLDTLAGAINGDIQVHIHCYRADEMTTMLDLADEFGFKVAAFHHGVEAYKIADRLAAEGVCGALWADWWGFKMEAFDGIQENIALVDRPEGGCAIVHSDSAEGIQRLNQEAAKVIAHAKLAGIDIPPERAIRWLTSNAARSLGILDQTGTLEPGKMADVVVWNREPFSVYARAEQVYVDGARVFDLADRNRQPVSDFMLGHGATDRAGITGGVE